jgi:hypothetical protein
MDSDGGRARDAAAPSELGVVNLIAHHDEEAHEQLIGGIGLAWTLCRAA